MGFISKFIGTIKFVTQFRQKLKTTLPSAFFNIFKFILLDNKLDFSSMT